MNPIRLVLFDITGTIIKDTGDMVRAMIMALRKNEISVDEGELREWRGAAKRQVIRHFVGRQLGSATDGGDQRIDRIYDDFRSMKPSLSRIRWFPLPARKMFSPG